MKRLALLGLLGLAFLVGCNDPEHTCNPGTKVLTTEQTEDVNGDTTVTVTCSDGKSWEVDDE